MVYWGFAPWLDHLVVDILVFPHNNLSNSRLAYHQVGNDEVCKLVQQLARRILKLSATHW
jgi:hypothetical protein